MSRKATPRLTRSRIEVPPIPDKPLRIKLENTVGESVLADLKKFHIRPSAIIDRELKRETRRRKKLLRVKEKKQIVNRYCGEVLCG